MGKALKSTTTHKETLKPQLLSEVNHNSWVLNIIAHEFQTSDSFDRLFGAQSLCHSAKSETKITRDSEKREFFFMRPCGITNSYMKYCHIHAMTKR